MIENWAKAARETSQIEKNPIWNAVDSIIEKTKNLNNIGQRVTNIVKSGTSVSKVSAGTRLLEEVVELALESGASSEQIYNAVSDTLHKEANKTNIYPSEISRKINEKDLLEELADVYILLNYISDINSIDFHKIVKEAETKVTYLEELNKNGEIYFKENGKFYRKKV